MEFYHRVPDAMVGTTLYPLETLLSVHEEVGQRQMAKYEGRERLARTYIPCLSCKWTEVVQMVAVPLTVIHERLRLSQAGGRRYFRISSDSLDRDRLAVYYRNDPETEAEVFDPFDESLPIDRPSPGFQEWFREAAAEGRPPRLYVGLPHILYRGEIDVSACPIAELE